MKYLISSLSFILFIGLFNVSAQKDENAEKTASSVITASEENLDEVQVYYFHATRRCATCEAVEAVSKEAINEYFGDKVAFESINREEKENNQVVEKYKISGTALLVINGDNVVDLTNDAFLNARTKPDKLKRKLKSTIDSMM
jgi:hypothetical protein